MKNQKGITLIALVITIIVLLILAGVSIAMLTGENGILTQATESRTATNKAEAVEKINLALNAAKTEIYKQQVTNSSYLPIKDTAAEGSATPSYELDTAIATILSKDGVGTTTGSDKYVYNLDTATGILTVSYYNETTKVGTSAAPISGKINLSTATVDSLASYEIDKAE